MLPISIDWDSLPFEFGYERLKKYLRIYDDAANSEHRETIELLVKAAIEAIQTETRQTFVKSTFRKVFSGLPATLPAFPVVALSKFEYYNGTAWQEVAIAAAEISEEFSQYSSGNWRFYLDTDAQPETISGQVVAGAKAYRLTWEAGYSIWPKDLILLVCQIVAENFDEPGATSKQIALTKSHERTLEHYRTHHDALRWA